MSNPSDLNIVPQPDTNKNFFNFKAAGLKIDKNYAIKFQWVYDDGELSDWSPGYFINTSTEIVPSSPTASVPSTSTGSIPVTLSTFPANAKRVDVYVINGIFGTGRVAYSFSSAGTATIAAPAGSYQVQLITVTPSNINGTPSETFTITISDVGETIQAPTSPNGFSSKRILAGIEVSWAGTYSDSTFTGFEAINIYAGSSATATPGTFEQVGVLTGNNLKNTIVVPLGTYVVYGQAVYIHAAAVNKSGAVGTIQANVTNQLLGPGKATDADINDGAVVISKLASDVLTVGNLKAGDINATSFIRAGTASSARVEISSSTVGSVLPGLTVYASDGVTQLLRAPLTGGLTINGGGTFSGALSAASGSFTGSLSGASGDFTGTVTANSGSIGNWVINSGKLASASGSTPSIELDPLTPQIVIRGSGSYAGYNITLSAPSGITAGSTFGVTPAGYLTSTSGQIGGWTVGSSTLTGGGTSLNSNGTISLTGGTFSSGGESITAGNLTLQSGAITNNSSLFMTSNGLTFDSYYGVGAFSYPAWSGSSVFYAAFSSRVTYNGERYVCVLSHTSTPSLIPSTSKSGSSYYWVEEGNSYLFVGNTASVHIGERGTYFTELGSPRNALSFRINTYDVGDGYFGRGYVLTALDTSEFKMTSINGSGIAYRTVLAGPYGQLLTGRAFYYGSSGTSAAINTEVGGSLGDVYFSTT